MTYYINVFSGFSNPEDKVEKFATRKDAVEALAFGDMTEYEITILVDGTHTSQVDLSDEAERWRWEDEQDRKDHEAHLRSLTPEARN